MPNQERRRLGQGQKWDPETVPCKEMPCKEMPFEAVVSRFQNELYATANRILGERTQAEDALQDTFLKAYRAMDSLKPGSNIRAWLYRILINTAYDQLDKAKSRTKALENLKTAEQTKQETSEVDQAERSRDLRTQVEDAIRTLPEKYRDALLLRSIQGLPYSGVASALDVPETTARSLVHRGKRLLLPKVSHLLSDLEI